MATGLPFVNVEIWAMQPGAEHTEAVNYKAAKPAENLRHLITIKNQL